MMRHTLAVLDTPRKTADVELRSFLVNACWHAGGRTLTYVEHRLATGGYSLAVLMVEGHAVLLLRPGERGVYVDLCADPEVVDGDKFLDYLHGWGWRVITAEHVERTFPGE